MEAIFYACPMTSDGADPLSRRLSVVHAIADVVPIFGEREAVTGAEMLNAYSAAGMREVNLHGLNGR
jgi:hypothetical protein